MNNNFPTTFSEINITLPDKEFILQHQKRKFRCISWHPHYITTDWFKTKEEAIEKADKAIEKFYENKEIKL
jgi:hypothetical protein